MNAVLQDHPSGSLLNAYSLGQLGEADLAGIDSHLTDCEICRQVVDGVVPDTFLSLLRSADTDSESIADTTEAGPSDLPHQALINHPRYKVGELLGVGGMGAVYRAEHLLMERPVALKVLNREWMDNPATIERFRREVRAAARLTHPNIVAAFDAEQAGDVHFLAMEYVEGVSLAKHIAEAGPLQVPQACEYIRQAALGLEHAHECGMVHRDIKPQNLMLTPDGKVKILDFGLARFVMESVPAGAMLAPEQAPAPDAPEGHAKALTLTGTVMGTPDYIAPEQARDSHLADIRADIYSLGCTLYDLLVGHAPFPGGSAVQKVKSHLERTPRPLKDLRRDVPTELLGIVERMMAKDPADRFQTPIEVAAALTPFVAAPPQPPRRKRWPAVAAAFAFLAALVAGTLIYIQTDYGTIVIETKDDNLAVMIQKLGGVKIIDQANKREYLLRLGAKDVPSGSYQIEVSEPLAGLTFQVNQFELKRGKEVRLVAKMVGKGVGGAEAPATMSANEPVFRGKPANFWLSQFKDSDAKLRIEAVEALGNISVAQKTKEFIPALVEAFKDKRELVSFTGEKYLHTLGADALPFLHEVLQDKSSKSIMYRAIQLVGTMGPRAKSVVPLLIPNLELDRWSWQGVPLFTRSWQSGSLPGVPPSMVGGLGAGPGTLPSSAQTIYSAAVFSLGEIGPEARPAIPAMLDLLERFLKTPAALETTNTIFESPKEIAFEAESLPVFFAEAIKKIDPNTSFLAPVGVSDKNLVENWQQAIKTLRKRYPAELAQAGTTGTRPSAGELPATLSANEPIYRGKPASFWLNQFKDSDAKLRIEAVEALGNISVAQKTKEFIPVLVEAFKDNRRMVSSTASTYLQSLGADALPFLHEVLQDKSSKSTLYYAIELVGWMGPQARSAVPLLIPNLELDSWQVPSPGFIRLGPSSVQTIYAAAVIALGEIGPEAKPAMPAMLDLLEGYLKTKTALEDTIEKEFGSKEGTIVFKASSLPVLFAEAIKKIDPDISFLAPLGVSDKNLVENWQQAIKALRKRYPAELAQAGTAGAGEDGDLFYGGKPTSLWLKQLQDINPTFRIEAVDALGHVAQKNHTLIVVLVAALKDDGKGKHSFAINAGDFVVGKHSFATNAGDFVVRETTVAEVASSALGMLGPVAVPPLIDLLKDKKASERTLYLAVGALFRIGPTKAEVPVLLDLAKNQPSDKLLQRVTNMLGIIGASAEPAVPVLQEILKTHKNPSNVEYAIWALGRIGPAANPSVPTLIDFLGEYVAKADVKYKKKKAGDMPSWTADDPLYMGMVVATALNTILPELREILPATDPFPTTPSSTYLPLLREAYETLRKKYPAQPPPSGPTATDTTDGTLFRGKPASFWMSQSKDAEPDFRFEAVQALGYFAKKDKAMVPLLLNYLQDDNAKVTREAAMKLADLDYSGIDVVRPILELLRDKSPRSVKNASLVIYYMGRRASKAKEAVPLLTDALKINDWEVRQTVLLALGEIGPDAKSALPAMTNCLLESITPGVAKTDNFAWIFGGVLLKIDPEIQVMTPNANLKHLDYQRLREVYDALKKKYPAPTLSTSGSIKTGPTDDALYAGKPTSVWLKQFQDGSPTFRAEAVDALGYLAKQNHDLIPLLIRALKDGAMVKASAQTKSASSVAKHASTALGKLGAIAVPPLLEVLKDKSSPLTLSLAANALGRIGPDAQAAVPLLEQTLKTPARMAAIVALGAIGPAAKSAIPSLIDVMGETLISETEETKGSKGAGGLRVGAALVGQALANIEPQLRELLPTADALQNAGDRKDAWQKAYEALRAKYQPRNQ